MVSIVDLPRECIGLGIIKEAAHGFRSQLNFSLARFSCANRLAIWKFRMIFLLCVLVITLPALFFTEGMQQAPAALLFGDTPIDPLCHVAGKPRGWEELTEGGRSEEWKVSEIKRYWKTANLKKSFWLERERYPKGVSTFCLHLIIRRIVS
jgi:hypothetical protein